MKKKEYIILGIIVVIAIIIIGNFTYNKNTNKKVNSAEIEKVVLDDGSASIHSTYNIYNTGEIEFNYFKTGNSKQLKQNVSKEQIEQIFNLINNYDLDSSKWKKNDNEYDGGTKATLEITYTNGKKVEINNESDLRKTLVKELEKILDNISGINVDEI